MPISRTVRISILLVIDILFFFAEIIVGYIVGSLALVADSFHMLNDILSLIISLYAIKLTSRSSNARYSYGWHRAEILAALVNGVFLLALCLSIFMQAIERFFSKPDVDNPKLVVIIGSLGLASNIVGLFLFHEHDHSHSNAKHDLESTMHEKEAVEPTAIAREETQRAHNWGTTSPLFGLPAATRLGVVQEALELQQNRANTRSFTSSSTMSYSSFRTALSQPFAERPRHTNTENRIEAPGTAPQLKPGGPQNVISPDHQTSQNIGNSDFKPPPQEKKAGSMNMRALVLHVLGDALGNIGVIATGLVMWLTKLSWKDYFDPMVSIILTCIIFSSALPLTKSASFILLQGVPDDISLQEVDEAIRKVEGVYDVHELHIWQLSESKIVASVHVHVSRKHDFMKIASEIRQLLNERGIESMTIQPEYYRAKNSPTSTMPLNGSDDTNRNCLTPAAPAKKAIRV